MSEIKKWMKIMESVPSVVATPEIGGKFSRDTTVVISPNQGGGVGRFVEFTPNGGALIDIKGITKELAQDSFSLPERGLDTGNDWFHMSVKDDTPGTSNDQPEFRPGDMVKVADVYGTVIGPGFGVFIGYGTTGQDCIVLFDGKQIVVPIENVASVLEQNAKDSFDEMDNDGNLSPMSFGSDNVRVEEPTVDNRDEFSRWIDTVEEALTNENGIVIVEPEQPVCGCNHWNCEVCFPETDKVNGATLNTIADFPKNSEIEAAQNEIAFDMDNLEEVSIEDENDFQVDNDEGVQLGDFHRDPRTDTVGQESPLTFGDDNLREQDVEPTDADLVAIQNEPVLDPTIDEIMNIQALGLSMSEHVYSEEELNTLLPDQLEQVKQEVMGGREFPMEHTVQPISPIGQTLKESIIMENVDKDIAAMLASLKKYDMLTESVAPVLEKKKPDADGDGVPDWADKKPGKDDNEEVKESEEKNPWEKLAKGDDEKDDGPKVGDSHKTEKGGTVTKTEKGLVHKRADEAVEEADPEVIGWMQRFARLGKL